MTNKIEWYKEVLSLEPASKVFFPLARLYVASGQTDEAVAVLRRGLDRHPEHLEARFLLMELTAAGSPDAVDEARLEAGRLAAVLAAYPSFWRLWAAEAAPDLALPLRLMAAQLSGRPLSLTRLLERGLDACEAEAAQAEGGRPAFPPAAPGPVAVAAAAPVSAEAATAAPEPVASVSLPLAAAAVGVAAVAAVVGAAGEAVAPAAGPTPEASGEDVPSGRTASEPSFEFSLDDEPEGVSAPAGPAARQADGDDDEDIDEELAWLVEDAAPLPAPEVALLDDLPLDLSDEDIEDDDDGLEVSPSRTSDEASLRTATMAELLAGQGDHAAALEIFRELLEAAGADDQRRKLSARIAELEGQLGRPAAPEPVAAEPPREERPAGEGRSKKKLLGVLESLAGRLESRASSGS